MPGMPENLYIGELVSFPGPYAFEIGKATVIVVRDEELEILSSDPDRVIDLSLTYERREDSLRSLCERARDAGQRTLLLSFDHFFKQYRPGTDAPRRLMPDTDEYIAHVARVGAFAARYGLALELSLLSPLEIGPGYRRSTGESGLWMHYRKGLRDPQTGLFSVQLWRQRQWVNNKGPLAIEDAGVRVFAFRERPVAGSTFLHVDPREIVEITDAAEVEMWPGATLSPGDYRAVRARVHGNGRTDVGPLDRVLVVQAYRVPEMDYFSDSALPFLTRLADRYVDAGVRFHALYSDEMHIQQDWGYFSHHDNGEFAVRYVSDGLRRRFAAAWGTEYRDFAKYLLYFCRGQEDARNDLAAKSGAMHTFGPSPEDIRRTALFRARYYKMLQDGVVDLFLAARRHLERRMGHRLETRAHATWAESPTIDLWNVGGDHLKRNQYEYTSNFVWSCTVHQAAAACHDYFKWGEYLTGTGNDHAETGWLDRNYYGLALACSTGIVNEIPYSYAAHWGSPRQVAERHRWLESAYGTAGSHHGLVQEMAHRDVEVLMLYPLDLVSADERFGSWMTQYGYANYLTSAKMLELGEVEDGAVEIAGRRFTALVVLFEPHPPAALLDMMRELAAQGGCVVWSSVPPLLSFEGESLLGAWSELFGLDHHPTVSEGLLAPGRRVEFAGPLAGVEAQTVLTDFLVDRVYPVTPREGTSPAAWIDGVGLPQRNCVGTVRPTAAGGSLAYLGFRPRDDQSHSLGYDARTWFGILKALGAYPSSGSFADTNDNTEVLSREGEYLACRFPNGAVSIAPHLRRYVESWPGGFGRDDEQDRIVLEQNPPPSPELRLANYRVWGHTVDYHGHGPVTFRLDQAGKLIAFAGQRCTGITIDGRSWAFADEPVDTLAWAPVEERRLVVGGAVAQIVAVHAGEVRIPIPEPSPAVRVIAEGPKPGSRGADVPFREEAGRVIVDASSLASKCLYLVPDRGVG